MLDQIHLSLHKTSTTKEREGYFLKPYYTFYTLTIQSENKERWWLSTFSIVYWFYWLRKHYLSFSLQELPRFWFTLHMKQNLTQKVQFLRCLIWLGGFKPQWDCLNQTVNLFLITHLIKSINSLFSTFLLLPYNWFSILTCIIS